MMKKQNNSPHVLVTGSRGFVGTALINELKNIGGYYILCCDKKDGYNVKDLTKEYLEYNNIDCVVHLAAQTSVWNDDNELIAEDNISAFVHIFELCRELDIKFIYASSSCSVNITSMYGLSKQFDDNYAKLYWFDKCYGLRFHNVFGKESRKNTLLGMFMESSKEHPLTLFNNGKNFRHFTYIKDVIRCIIMTIENNLESGLYNICNPQYMSVKEFCDIVKEYDDNLSYVLTSDIRPLDKAEQHIEDSVCNMLTNYTTVETAIKDIYENN